MLNCVSFDNRKMKASGCMQRGSTACWAICQDMTRSGQKTNLLLVWRLEWQNFCCSQLQGHYKSIWWKLSGWKQHYGMLSIPEPMRARAKLHRHRLASTKEIGEVGADEDAEDEEV